MLEGAYSIAAITPFGTKRGVAYIVENGEQVLTKIDMDGGSAKLYGTLAETNDTFVITGETTFKGRDLSFRIIGSVAGDVLTAQFVTSNITVKVSGRRISG